MNTDSYSNNIKDLVTSYNDSNPTKPFVYSFVIHKGGTGKSTLTGICASIASSYNLSVLVIDLDHSINITHSLTSSLEGVDLNDYGNVYELLKNDNLVYQKPVPIKENLHLLAGAPNSNELENDSMLIHRLKESIEEHYTEYDLILIDTHGDYADRSKCALVASDAFSAPLELSDYSILNLGGLLHDYNLIRRRFNKHLMFHGVTVNRVHKFVKVLGRKVPESLNQRKIYEEVVHFCKAYQESHNKQISVVGMLANRKVLGAFSASIELDDLKRDPTAYSEALEVVYNIIKLLVKGE